MMRRALALLAFAALLASGAALAHKPSDSYLTLAVDGETVTGQWDIALRDLDFALGLDGNRTARSHGARSRRSTARSRRMRCRA